MGSVLKKPALLNALRRDRRAGRRIVFTNGCFDILHKGHVQYLRKARALGDRLIVGVNTDASVRRLKGKDRPVNRETDRALILSCLSFVDYVILFREDTPEKLIHALRPDTLVKGGDWSKNNIVGADFVASYGGRTRVIPFIKGFSTTGILNKIERL